VNIIRNKGGNCVGVAFIILNWNKPDITIRAINSIMEHENVALRGDSIIVVDNNSDYDKKEELILFFRKNGWLVIGEEEIPEINFTKPSKVLVLNKGNYGYAKGNNIGLKLAKRIGYKYAVIMNNDVVIKEPVVDKLLPILKENEKIAVVGPRVIGPDGKNQGPSVKPEGLYYFFFLPLFYPFLYLPNKIYQLWKKKTLIRMINEEVSRNGFFITYWVMGCFMLVDIDVLESVGWFDETTFLYVEEAILSEKLSQVGYKMAYVPLVSVYHEHEVSTVTLGKKRYLVHLKSILYYFKKYRNYGVIRLWLIKVGFLYNVFILQPVLMRVKSLLRKLKNNLIQRR